MGRSEIQLNNNPSPQLDTLMVEGSSTEGVQSVVEAVAEVVGDVEEEYGFGPQDPPFFHYLALLDIPVGRGYPGIQGFIC